MKSILKGCVTMSILIVMLLMLLQSAYAQCQLGANLCGLSAPREIRCGDSPMAQTVNAVLNPSVQLTYSGGELSSTDNPFCPTYATLGFHGAITSYGDCSGAGNFSSTLMVSFSQPVSNVQITVNNYLTYAMTFIVTPDVGSAQSVDTDGRFSDAPGSAIATLPGPSISYITIMPDPASLAQVSQIFYGGQSTWYFSTDNISFTLDNCGSSTTLQGLYHCDPDDPNSGNCSDPTKWTPLNNNTAYFRDVVVSAKVKITNPADGETFGVIYHTPAGQSFFGQNSPIVFQKALPDGRTNCFTYPDNTSDCGQTSIEKQVFFNSQGALSENWGLDLVHDVHGGVPATVVSSSTFKLEPMLDLASHPFPGYVQGNFIDDYDNLCEINGQAVICPFPAENHLRIDNYGCTLTAFAYALSYHGIPTDPSNLNTFLENLHTLDPTQYGYNPNDGRILREGIQAYAKSNNRNLLVRQLTSRSFQEVHDNIFKTGPVVLGLYRNNPVNRPHAVAAYGTPVDLLVDVNVPTDINVKDTATGRLTLIDDPIVFPNNDTFFDEQLTLEFEQHTFNYARLNMDFHCPVQYFITDPQGRRTGYDPRSNTSYNEIPESFYGAITTDARGGDDLIKNLDIITPIDGEYTLTVIGTGTGTYQAEIFGTDPNLHTYMAQIPSTPTYQGAVATYKIQYAQSAASPPQLAGGFDGGGQRPKDVNKFLTYVNLTSDTTTLPAGTTSYPLIIAYANSTITSSFKATLNDVDVSASFHPKPGTIEVVNLPMQVGRNVLEVSIDGNLDKRVANDKDRLTFNVQ